MGAEAAPTQVALALGTHVHISIIPLACFRLGAHIKTMHSINKITHFRRYPDYDYSRGGSMFISFHLEPRIGVFGQITSDGQMLLSQAGLVLDETINIEQQKHPEITIRSYRIMPEHLHFRLTFAAGLDRPLYRIGRFVYDIKRWSKAKLAHTGISITWQENYHDFICLSRDINEKVDEYIQLNPMKWALMHGTDHPMKVTEPLHSRLLSPGEWWAGVGNEALLQGDYPLLSIRLSRKLDINAACNVIPGIVAECKKGLIPISTFLSPMEKALFYRLQQENLPIICAVPDELKTIYRPRTEQTLLFAQNRLLLLSHHSKTYNFRYEAWHSINDDIAKMAIASGGRQIYIRA